MQVRESTPIGDTVQQLVPPSWRAAAEQKNTLEPLAISNELREFLHANVRENALPRDRILALTSAIIDPDGIGLVYDDLATHTAAEAFATGRGNCLGFSNLLVAAAREVGIQAKFELVSNFRSWQKQGGLLVSSLHVRVVSTVNGRRMVFDFHPQPVAVGSWSEVLSDSEALSHHMNNLAITSMQEGDYADAYGKLLQAIDISPHIGFLWSNLGALFARRNMNDLAEAAYKEAIYQSPESLPAVSNLQLLYIRLGREEEANDLAGQILEHRKRNPYHQFRLAELAYNDSRYDEAIKHYRAAIRLKKNDRDFYLGLAEAYSRLGKAKAADYNVAKADRLAVTPVNRMNLRVLDK